MASKVGKLTKFIGGLHVMGVDGLRDYHRARETVDANRCKTPQAKLAAAKHALKNHRVMVSLSFGQVRIFRPDTREEFMLSDGSISRIFLNAEARQIAKDSRTIESVADRWAARIGLGFHPDTRGADYTPAMTPAEIAEYDSDMNFLCEHAADEYQCAIDAMQRAGLIDA